MSELFNTDGETNTVTTSKYDSWDLEALKRKAEAADAHISAIENENAALRENTDTTTTLEQILEKLDQSHRQPQNTYPSNVANQPTEKLIPSDAVKRDEVLTLVSQALESNQKKTIAKQNVDVIHRELERAWGPNYKQTLVNKTQQLNVSQDYISHMAETHPQLLLKLVLEDKTTTNPNSHVPPSTTRPVVSNHGPMEKYSDFSKAMRDNPTLKHDVAFNKKMHETAERIGPSFF